MWLSPFPTISVTCMEKMWTWDMGETLSWLNKTCQASKQLNYLSKLTWCQLSFLQLRRPKTNFRWGKFYHSKLVDSITETEVFSTHQSLTARFGNWRYIFWDITLCSPPKVKQSIGGTCLLHLQGWRVHHARNEDEGGNWLSSDYTTLIRMLHSHQCENLKSYKPHLNLHNFITRCSYPVAGPWGHSNEPSGCIKDMQYLQRLSNC